VIKKHRHLYIQEAKSRVRPIDQRFAVVPAAQCDVVLEQQSVLFAERQVDENVAARVDHDEHVGHVDHVVVDCHLRVVIYTISTENQFHVEHSICFS